MLAIINDAAQAYRGVIPPDRWHEPYMPRDELADEIAHGVEFWVAEQEGRMAGVMGIQDKGDVALVRHAYVVPTTQRSGVGTSLLRHVEGLVEKPILIGTWANASWAIAFYRRNGFDLVSSADKDRLLRTYWSIPPRQIETSVVLANAPVESIAGSHPGPEYFRSLERTRTAALVERNMDLLQSLHAPEYQLITPAGKTFDRESYLGAIADGTLRYVKWELGEIEVRASQSMAIVRYRARLEFPSGNSVACWHTDSYEPRGDLWQAVWSQATCVNES